MSPLDELPLGEGLGAFHALVGSLRLGAAVLRRAAVGSRRTHASICREYMQVDAHGFKQVETNEP